MSKKLGVELEEHIFIDNELEHNDLNSAFRQWNFQSILTMSLSVLSTSVSSETLFDFFRIESLYLANNSADLFFRVLSQMALLKKSILGKWKPTHLLTKSLAAWSSDFAKPESFSRAVTSNLWNFEWIVRIVSTYSFGSVTAVLFTFSNACLPCSVIWS